MAPKKLQLHPAHIIHPLSLLWTSLWCSLMLLSCTPKTPARPFASKNIKSNFFCSVGDLQRTSIYEFWRTQNDQERTLVLKELARRTPAFVVSLGDIVFNGASHSQWKKLEGFAAPLYRANIPIFPVLGNHEYWGHNPTALKLFFDHFPHLNKKHWYTRTFGNLALLFLDSNQSDLGNKKWRLQKSWFKKQLRRFDKNPKIRGIFVFLHHPPYTNSTVTRDELHVQRTFVPPFLRSQKTLLMLTGHVHSYEHFVRKGKTFLISGGGGGPRARLLRGDKRRHKDDLFKGPALRPFHYTCFTPLKHGVLTQMHKLNRKTKTFSIGDRFLLRWSQPTKAKQR